jgi:hypothetical protein
MSSNLLKKLLVLITAFMLIFSSLVYAGGDKNRGEKGQGSTGIFYKFYR